MFRSTSIRLAVLALAAGLIAVLPASAAAKPKAKTKTELVSEPFLLNGISPDDAEGFAACPSRTTLIGGGVITNVPISQRVEINVSAPFADGWLARLDNDSNLNQLPVAQAICLKDRLKVTGIDGSPRAISKVRQEAVPFSLPPDVAPTNGIAEVDAICPSGTTLVGGGASFPPAIADIKLTQSAPLGNGWHVRFDNDESNGLIAIATALCLKSKLKVEDENDKARTKVEQVSQQVAVPVDTVNGGRAAFDIACPSGTTVVGGGGRFVDSIAPSQLDIFLVESGVVGNSWHVRFDSDEATTQAGEIHALCLKNKLKVK